MARAARSATSQGSNGSWPSTTHACPTTAACWWRSAVPSSTTAPPTPTAAHACGCTSCSVRPWRPGTKSRWRGRESSSILRRCHRGIVMRTMLVPLVAVALLASGVHAAELTASCTSRQPTCTPNPGSTHQGYDPAAQHPGEDFQPAGALVSAANPRRGLRVRAVNDLRVNYAGTEGAKRTCAC